MTSHFRVNCTHADGEGGCDHPGRRLLFGLLKSTCQEATSLTICPAAQRIKRKPESKPIIAKVRTHPGEIS